MLTFKKCNFVETSSKEWLVTNGIGGYASSTINGANTRRYHGLLVASLNPPTQRPVLVSKIEECVGLRRDTCISISTNRYPGVIHPSGYQYIQSFDKAPLPRTIFEVGGSQIAKTVFMVYGSNTTIVEYENISQSTYLLEQVPVFVNRDYHSLYKESAYHDYYYEKENNVLKLYAHYGAMPLYFKYFSGDFSENRQWFKNFEYDKENYRGLDFQEDGYSVGKVKTVLEAGEKTYLVFTLDKALLNDNPAKLKAEEIARLAALRPETKHTFFNDLAVAGDQFLVKRASTDSHTILAGYHWFTDWGRDTMIAMRGLCIAAGKQEISKSILTTFFNSLSEGMLPNRFPDFAEEELEYNTVDATLWLFVALYEYYNKFGDKEYVEAHFSKLTSILAWHFKGTRFNIHLTKEGFIFAGEGITQLTWMDARVGDFVVTPRHGCPVEIQALWYNALKIYEFFASEMDCQQDANVLKTCKSVCKKLKTNFSTYFINDKDYLNDVVVPNESADDSIRPNQIYVVSLPFALLTKAQEKKIFTIVQKELYTPLGLRSLNPDHKAFKPIYKGDQWQRDTAYHQGTVWAFLLGDYFLAQLKVNNHSAKARKEVIAGIEALKSHFYLEDCIQGISEIFDGLNPKDGRGTTHQAWSISGLMLAYLQGELL